VCYVACTAEIMLRCVVWCVQLTETVAVDRDHSFAPCAALRCAVWRVRAAEIILRCVMCTAEMMVCYVACTAEIMVCYVACTAEIMLRCVVWCVQLTETIAVDRDHSLQLAALFNLHSAECAAVVKVRPCSPVDSPSGLDASA
jgi:hypothetical protein